MEHYLDASRAFVASILAGLERLGVLRGELTRRLGGDPLGDDAPRGRVPLQALGRLWPALERLTGRDGWGLRLAGEIDVESWSVFGRSLRGSSTLGDALVRAGRFLPLLVGGADLFIHALPSGKNLVIFVGRSPLTRHRESVEFALGAIVRIARAVLGEDVPLCGVRFARRAPSDGRDYSAIFSAPVEHRRAQDALILDSTTLLRPLPRFDGGLAEVLDREVEARLTALPRRESVARKAQSLMRAELMAEGAPSVDGVAAQLGMPARTLSRRLRSEGSSFQSVLDGLRLDLADRFLVDSTMSVSEVALALGYSDPSAFNKAFRRWTGQAPHAYRRRRSPTV